MEKTSIDGVTLMCHTCRIPDIVSFLQLASPAGVIIPILHMRRLNFRGDATYSCLVPRLVSRESGVQSGLLASNSLLLTLDHDASDCPGKPVVCFTLPS